MTTRSERVAIRLYAITLRAYPAKFRRAYGSEMSDVFLASLRNVRRKGSAIAWFKFVYRTTRDAIVNSTGARFDNQMPQRKGGRVPPSRGAFASMLSSFFMGARILRQAPGFSIFVAGVLASGVCAATVILAGVYDTLWKPLPFDEPDKVVIAWGSTSINGQLRDVVSGPIAVDLHEQNNTLSALAAFKPDDVVVMRDGQPLVVSALTVTTEFFDAFGVSPFLGRWFSQQEGFSGSQRVVVVSHAFWRDELGGDSAAVGSAVELNGAQHAIVGVIPTDFYFTQDVVLPLEKDVLESYNRTNYDYWLVGRMRDDVTVQIVSDDLNGIFQEIAAKDSRLTNWSILVEPFQSTVVEALRLPLLALLAAVGCLWAIAIVNVTNLFLVRMSGRQHTFALHRALGASGFRVGAIVFGETVSLTLIGWIVGMTASLGGLKLLQQISPPTVPIPGSAARMSFVTPSLSAQVVVLVALVTLVGCVIYTISSLVSLRGSTKPLVHGENRTQSVGRRAVRANVLLVGVEIAIATMLLVSAGLSLRTLVNLLDVDAGVRPSGVLTMYVGDLDIRTNGERARFFDAVIREVDAVPGVSGVGLNDYVPFQSEDDFEGIRFPERPNPLPGEGPREEWRRVSSGYFEAAGVSLLRGRVFSRADTETSPSVAIVNRAFANRYYPDQDPVGRQMRLTNSEYGMSEVVGVVDDVRRRGLRQAAPPVVYVPFHRRPRPNMAIFIRTDGDPRQFVDAVKAAVWVVDPGQPIDRIQPFDDVVNGSVGIPRLMMQLVGGLSALALTLAAIGIGGVMAYSVRLREREFGIRVAVGASPGVIRRLVLRNALIVTMCGLSAGVAAAIFLARSIEGLLFGVAVADPLTLLVVATIMTCVAMGAGVIPSWRAARIDPVETLRAG